MRAQDIEAWAAEVVARVITGQSCEDSRVELKAEWPKTPLDAAKRLAGHANAAVGGKILWIIGVDEKRGVVGARQQDLANWFPQIESCFDAMAPSVDADVVVSIGEQSCVALLFDTSNAPYVVKDREQRLVFWREATRIRYAGRSELLALARRALSRPKVEILGGGAEISPAQDRLDHWTVEVQLRLYVTPQTKDQVVLPLHTTYLRLPGIASADARLPGRSFYLPEGHTASMVSRSVYDVVFCGPGAVELHARGYVERGAARMDEPIRIELCLLPDNAGESVVLQAWLDPSKPTAGMARPSSVRGYVVTVRSNE